MANFTFRLPDLGEGIAEGQVLEWLVDEGATVAADDPLVEVETDKAVVEIPSPVDGVVRKIHVTDGASAKGGDALISFTVEKVNTPSVSSETPSASGSPTTAVPPALQRLADRLGVDCDGLTGTGPGGRVTEADVRDAAPAHTTADDSATTSASPRATIARRLTAAAAVPTVTNVVEVDVDDLMSGGVPPLTAFAVAVVRALGDHPRLNAHCDPDGPTLQPQDGVNLGIATQGERGLLVPVVRDAHLLDSDALEKAMHQAAAAARDGHATPADMRGSTITITSAGRLAGQFSTPLLNLPEVAIVGMYAIQPRPAVVDGHVVVRQRTNLSITFDHRVLDGMDAAMFIQQVKQLMEQGHN
ncbi:dihydrolipoamide acetyltransferase family protein [soil metagenome]